MACRVLRSSLLLTSNALMVSRALLIISSSVALPLTTAEARNGIAFLASLARDTVVPTTRPATAPAPVPKTGTTLPIAAPAAVAVRSKSTVSPTALINDGAALSNGTVGLDRNNIP